MISKKRGSESNKNVQHKPDKKPKFRFSFAYKNKSSNFSLTIDSENIELLEQRIVEDIVQEALIINIPTGTAEVIAKKVANAVAKKMKKKERPTDVDACIAEEMSKYHDNLSYVYKNRGKII